MKTEAYGLSTWLALGLSIAICFSAAGIGSLFTDPEIGGWYARIEKPSWTPPNWVFGPVWSVLYLMMAVAAWLVWKEKGFAGAAAPLALFGAQLVFNALWSILFFGMHRMGLALLDIILLWSAILATLLSFWRVSPAAGALMIPYLLWVTYASALNYSIWRVNS
ncbi:MAG TPA: TspO/MBR family protein [Pyrinomonadaceae bacterium]|jgi:tryptophan-rich sensory protein